MMNLMNSKLGRRLQCMDVGETLGRLPKVDLKQVDLKKANLRSAAAVLPWVEKPAPRKRFSFMSGPALLAAAAVGVAAVRATLASATGQVREWAEDTGSEARFMLIRKLAADETVMRRTREMLEDSSPGGSWRYRLARGSQWLPAAGVGAGLMYFFDPRYGGYRRRLAGVRAKYACRRMRNTVADRRNGNTLAETAESRQASFDPML